MKVMGWSSESSPYWRDDRCLRSREALETVQATDWVRLGQNPSCWEAQPAALGGWLGVG